MRKSSASNTPTPPTAPRYYQQIAINRAVEAILAGKKRLLLTMATGTGKTIVAFQICWKLWSSRWNRTGEHRKPRILFLADRNILIDDPKDKTFTPFGDARHKIESGEIVKSREMYFAIYQALAEDERRAGLFRDYPPDFFDLIIVDECHRGSARDDSSWRVILEHFKPAYQLGMTATPLRVNAQMRRRAVVSCCPGSNQFQTQFPAHGVGRALKGFQCDVSFRWIEQTIDLRTAGMEQFGHARFAQLAFLHRLGQLPCDSLCRASTQARSPGHPILFERFEQEIRLWGVR
ncbi:DEAD/DEAH box helicase family protein [Algiphilus sp. W345]|uniref:DEAD/DEAH box helicase family protein n=1 Tax=Banduia mediterranea TaxID=3075609 RepID=A0ABU2WF32_9GAMM|nr:DEAD/DEAH box helicase family protein [Algiphilus sp. W345]MDT0496478.1 DEAD/DEAH box helicase family protein [Algiphilus sp. W345]